jgi:aminopeptidase N
MKLFFTLFSLFAVSFCTAQNAKGILEEMKMHTQQERQTATDLLNAQRNTTALSGAGTNYDVKHYRCEWQIDPAVKYIAGKVTMTYLLTTASNSIVLDLNKVLIVDSVLYKGNKITFTQNTNNTVTINFPTFVNANTADNVSIFYQGVPPTTGNGSFIKSAHAGVPIIWTLSEPFGASDWWPCKDVLNDKADSVDIIMTCPAIYKNSSNGIIVSDIVAGANRTTHYKHRYPITSYLVAIACTNYVVASSTVTINGIAMPFENWTYPESALSFSYQAYGVENALNWFSGFYGTYPFITERYAQTQFGWGGGQEHQTNSFIVSPNHLERYMGERMLCLF